LKQVEVQRRGTSGAAAGGSEDVVKRLKKRELECSALWDTLRDMYVGQKKSYNVDQMMNLLSLRALDTKAKRKLGL